MTVRDPQVVFESESIVEVLRHLERHRRDGIPVLSEDGLEIVGWVTNSSIVHSVSRKLAPLDQDAETRAVQREVPDETVGRSPMPGYHLIEIGIGADSRLAGRELRTIEWPAGSVAASVLRDDRYRHADDSVVLRPGDRIGLLTRAE